MQHYGQYQQNQTEYYNEENIHVSLYNEELWNKFHEITNEMIVTKVGRRMFPIISINIRGLDPDKMYTVELNFEQIDSHRWRYVSSEWQPGTKPDPLINRSPYQHPDSPNYGRKWMNGVISFPKVKLTNKIDNTGPSQVVLNSLHKYRPIISIIDVMSKEKVYETSFDETEFIAVTAYQNEEVKALKIRNNPFAKAFLDSASIKREMIEEPMFYNQESSSGGPDRIKLVSHRLSAYNYPQSRRKSSPRDVPQYPASLTPPVNNTCASPFLLTDNTGYYANSYYPPPPSSHYFPYVSSPSSSTTTATASHYPFIPTFNYPLNNNPTFEPTSFLHMQTPMGIPSNEINYLNSLTMKDDHEQY